MGVSLPIVRFNVLSKVLFGVKNKIQFFSLVHKRSNQQRSNYDSDIREEAVQNFLDKKEKEESNNNSLSSLFSSRTKLKNNLISLNEFKSGSVCHICSDRYCRKINVFLFDL